MSARPTRIPLDDGRWVDVIEEVRTYAPLGIRFWDWTTDAIVADGLAVEARPVPGGRTTASTITRSGIHVLAGLDGAREVEWPPAGEVDPPAEGSGPDHLVRVRDVRRRFVSIGLEVAVPTHGLVLDAVAFGAATPGQGLPLHSSAERPIPPGCAAVRADLVDASTGGPAAHALAIVTIDGEASAGIADADGRLAVVFPFPTFAQPTGSNPLPPEEQQFDATVEVRYEPAAAPVEPWLGTPRLADVVGQAQGRLEITPGTPVDEHVVALGFRRPLVLRTGTQPHLLLHAA